MTQTDPATPPCSTSTDALADYGVEDGSRLVRRTYYDLVEDGFDDYDGSEAYLRRVADTFRALLVEVGGVHTVPDDVDAALDDAVHATDGLVSVGADLRTELLPTFYRQFAGYVCAYQGRPLQDAADD